MTGKTIGNYKILNELGSGGMGTVFLAENISLGTKVAIKSLHPHLIKSQSIKSRFLKEAKMQAILDHKGITKVIDFVDNENGLFIILEYIEGESLDNFLFKTKGLLPENEANFFMLKILDAVDYAHSKGIVHRDLKTANIMITPNKNIKIMDFGIAKLNGENLGLTKIGSKLGSPLYMSPEQVIGGNVDFRSDIYSLGVIYHEMLTGKPVYNQHTTSEFEIYDKIIKQPLPRLKTFYKLISDQAQAIVDKATHKSPEGRFQSCNEFINAIKNRKINDVKNELKKNKDDGKKENYFIPIFLGIIFLILISIGGIYYMSENKNDLSNSINKANLFIEKEDYKNAIEIFQDILNKDENNRLVQERLNEVYILSKLYEQKKVKEILFRYIGVVTLNDFNETVPWKNKLTSNYNFIKTKFLELENNQQITDFTILNQEKENLETLNIFFNSLKYYEQKKIIEAANILNEISNVNKYPIIENYKNLLATKILMTKPDKELQTILEKARAMGATEDQIQMLIDRYNAKKGNESVVSKTPIKDKELQKRVSRLKSFGATDKQIQKAIDDFNKTKQVTEHKNTKEKEKIVEKSEEKNETENISVSNPTYFSIQMVDKAPIFPGCESKSGVELISCFDDKINKFIDKNHNINAKNIPIGEYKVIIHFKINNKGNIEQITVQTENEMIKNEIIRVLKSMPIMVPAINDNIPVGIYYRLSKKFIITQ